MHDELKKALDVLYNGGIIIYPADTFWALGCDATNEAAVARLLEIKQAVAAGEMLILLDNAGRLSSYLDEVPDIAWDLIEMSEKPLTIIFSGARNLAANLLSEDKSVGMRVTNETFSRNLCARFKRPIVALTANVQGQPLPGSFTEISGEMLSKVDYAVDFRRNEKPMLDQGAVIRLGKGNLIKIVRE